MKKNNDMCVYFLALMIPAYGIMLKRLHHQFCVCISEIKRRTMLQSIYLSLAECVAHSNYLLENWRKLQFVTIWILLGLCNDVCHGKPKFSSFRCTWATLTVASSRDIKERETSTLQWLTLTHMHTLEATQHFELIDKCEYQIKIYTSIRMHTYNHIVFKCIRCKFMAFDPEIEPFFGLLASSIYIIKKICCRWLAKVLGRIVFRYMYFLIFEMLQ